MQAQRDLALDVVDSKTTAANSAIKREADKRAIVELDPDHPGFRDPAYRERRNHIAQIAIDYTPGAPIPDAPYTEKNTRSGESSTANSTKRTRISRAKNISNAKIFSPCPKTAYRS
jgi:phenylalanine-4-hydroxylase